MFGPLRSIGDGMAVEMETLSDKSKGYNLLVNLDHDPYARRIKIGCPDEQAVTTLARALEDVAFVELID